jgi:LPXTG-motif cell wall-anchored protein
VNKILATAAVLIAAVVGLGAPASAQPYPPVTPTVTAPSTVLPGATFVVVFNGCQLGETVNVTFTGVTVATSCTGAGGTGRLMQAAGGSASVTLTAPTAPGTYTITATGLTSGFTASTTITVVAQTTTTAATGGGGGGLPTTGSDSSSTVWIAGTAVIVGAGLLAVGLKRRRPAAS